jgi:diaminohydroxyphosphoribosylaminopyrimidine deaminase / 5-amino-6-(5-phosphoribosylamino)uracil reductase
MTEAEYMHRAITLARRGLGTTSPNPMVGAVVVKGGKVVGEGYHRKAGEAHAEIAALEKAGPRARGGTLILNLEPCCHTGRTPPCVNAIIKAGLRKVVVAMHDPNPLVNGRGIEMLRKAGIDVKVGLLEREAGILNEAFVTYVTRKRPFFVLKGAASLDGKIATRIGESKWISNEESREYANQIRSVMDGIMVGINTVILDNPFLLPRVSRPKRYPVRIVLDSKLRIPPSCELVKTGSKFRTLVFTLADSRQDKESRLKSMGIEVIRVASGENGRVALSAVCQELWEREITNVLVEGGGELNSCFIDEGLADKIVIFYAPKLIGGKSAPSLIGGKGIDFLKGACRIDITSVKRLKEDICVEGYVHRDN